MQTPISQIQPNNIQSSNAAAAVKKNTDSNKALANTDNDFQRTLARQIEQRQALKTAAQAQANKAPGAKPAPIQPGAAKPAQPTETRATEQSTQAAKADGAAKSSDQVAAEDEDTPPTPPPADPAADMLALMANMKQALAPQAAPAAQDAATTLTAAKRAAGLADPGQLKPDGAALATDATDAADANGGADFAAGLDAAKAKGAKLPDMGAAGKAAPDAALLAAKAKDGMAEQMAAIKEGAPDAAKVAAPVQQASLQVAEVATSIPADKLQGRVGTPAWDQQLGQKVVWMVGGGEQSATLTLNPPDLGPLQVVLKVTNEQTDAAFTSSQPEVRQALEAAMPRLREIMSEAGIQFGNATVSAGTQEQQNQASADARSSRGGGRGNGGGNDSNNSDGGAVRTVAPARRGGVEGMVDTFA